MRATDKESADWDEIPQEIKETFDRLGIPEAERKFLSGAGAQYESEVVYVLPAGAAEAAFDGVIGGGLERWIERRRHRKARLVERLGAVLPLKMLADLFQEERGDRA